MGAEDNLNKGILAEELVTLKLLELGFNVARPIQVGPVDLLSIWSGSVIKRLQIKSSANRTVQSLRYEFKLKPTNGQYGEVFDYFILAGVETKSFWVIPKKVAGDTSKANCTVGGNGQYDKFFNAFSLLRK